MAATIEFELVSPQRLLMSEPVEMAVVPCTEGDIGVLPGHSPLIASVRAGLIDIYQGGKIRESLFVGGGFVEVSPERCTVLAEEAVPIAEVERPGAENRLNRAKAALADAGDAGAKAAAEQDIRTAEALIKALEIRRPH